LIEKIIVIYAGRVTIPKIRLVAETVDVLNRRIARYGRPCETVEGDGLCGGTKAKGREQRENCEILVRNTRYSYGIDKDFDCAITMPAGKNL
jgi:hypothetical protein